MIEQGRMNKIHISEISLCVYFKIKRRLIDILY